MTSPPTENGQGNIYTTRPSDIQQPGPSGVDWVGSPSWAGGSCGFFQFLIFSRSAIIVSSITSSKNRHPCWHRIADSIRLCASRKNVSRR